MLLLSRFVLASTKHLRLRCVQCTQLLPATHFAHFRGTPLHQLVCVHCKRLCVVCGIRKPLDSFLDAHTDRCDRCMAKEEVAAGNVFFRYPTLKYRACPFSVDEMRGRLQREEGEKQQQQQQRQAGEACAAAAPLRSQTKGRQGD